MENPSNKIILKDDQILNASLHVIFYKDEEDGDIVIAHCSALKLSTHGDTLEEAKKMFDECFSLWVESVNEHREANKVLENLGWKFNESTAEAKADNDIKDLVEDYRIDNIPMHILDSKSFTVGLPSWSN